MMAPPSTVLPRKPQSNTVLRTCIRRKQVTPWILQAHLGYCKNISESWSVSLSPSAATHNRLLRMPSTVYLVSGANRGIGLGIVTALAARDDVVVFAGARNPSAATDLQSLVKKQASKVHVVKLTACDQTENEAAVAQIKAIAGRLDVVIANAGILQFIGPAVETPAEEMREHFNVNVVGTLVLFQAAYPLLKASTPSPKFIPISAGLGSIAVGPTIPLSVTPYGASKVAQNYLARKLHFEHEGLICFPIHPGLVDTDMAKLVFSQIPGGPTEEVKAHMITVEESVTGLLSVIDHSTREKEGGTFVGYNGDTWEW